ncbi:MAG: glycosyltransferase [Kiloniellaceae bacterium]
MPDPLTGRYDVLLYVQHLLGIGHVRRAAVLARAFQRSGMKVVLVTGGLPVKGLGLEEIEAVQLPPARSRDETFAVILDENDQPIDDAWKARRRALLLDVYRRCRPRVVMTELYPFGRRKMRFELEPLIDAARSEDPSVLIACSLRDIVNRPECDKKAAWMVDRFTRQFDLLFVHGDPAFYRLEDSFPECTVMAERLHYTGYVTEAGRVADRVRAGDRARARDGTADPDQPGSGEVIVSAGGGAVGNALLRAALAARPLSPLSDASWRLLIGPNLPETEFRALSRAAPAGVIVERARPDFAELLTRARLSISQGGYNTVMEILAAGLPGVVVPFAGGSETEQTHRAKVLAEHGLIAVVDEAGLTPDNLAEGIASALALGNADHRFRLSLDGAEETSRYLIAKLEEQAA